MTLIRSHATVSRNLLVRTFALYAIAGSAIAISNAAANAEPGLPAAAGAAQSATAGSDIKSKTVLAQNKQAAVKADDRGAGGQATSRSGTEQSIVALVNDEPITGFEIQQRAAMLGGGSMQQKAQENFKAILKNPKTTERLKAILAETIKANEGKSKDQIIAIFEARKKQFGMDLQKQAMESARSSVAPGIKKAALEELIEEKLKLQEAKRQGVTVDDAEISRVIAGIAERNKMTEAQFMQQLGGGADAMKNRIRSTLSWNDVIRRRFGAQIAITSRDVDKLVASSTSAAEDDVELRVQRIRIALPAKMDQASAAQRMQDAEQIRAKFTDCKSSGAIASGFAGAKFEELGKRRPSAFQEPTRTFLLNAKDGEMLPPSMGDGNVELWIVCGRDVVKGQEQQRTQAEGELKQKEFEILAKRHLKDLRQDAHIEYR